MASKKQQLDALLKFIDSLILDPQNKADFTDKLRAKFERDVPIDLSPLIIDKNKIEDIYEYCIEQIARNDAHSFYEGFCIPEIIPQLEDDFVKMEHWRRRGNVAEFCLALYEQYECIVNKLGSDPRLNDIFTKLITYHCYTDGESYNRIPYKEEYPLYKLIFLKNKINEAIHRPLSNQYAMDKFRAIYYLCYYGALMTSRDYQTFKKSCELIDDLYKIRCTNHRGNTNNEYEQDAIDRVNAQPIKFELKMLGHLSDFVEKINLHYTKILELKKYSESLKDKIYVPECNLKVVGYVDLNKVPKK